MHSLMPASFLYRPLSDTRSASRRISRYEDTEVPTDRLHRPLPRRGWRWRWRRLGRTDAPGGPALPRQSPWGLSRWSPFTFQTLRRPGGLRSRPRLRQGSHVRSFLLAQLSHQELFPCAELLACGRVCGEVRVVSCQSSHCRFTVYWGFGFVLFGGRGRSPYRSHLYPTPNNTC
jgi:hypothetical protein